MEALLWLVVAVLFCSVAANDPQVNVGPVDVLGGSWAQASGYLGVSMACEAGLAKGSSTKTGCELVW
jgi:hypothetical protein